MTTMFFNQLTQPQYETWQAMGAPSCILKPEYPKFSARVTHNNGYFVVETWQTSYVSVMGSASVQQHLRPSLAVKLTKDGRLGAKVVKLSDTVKWITRQAYDAWVTAGKPDEFIYVA